MIDLTLAHARAPETRKWIEYVASFGDAAKGVVYGIMGWLAIQVVIGAGGETAGPQEALEAIAHQPFGRLLLAVVAGGLASYAVWRIVEAWFDPENKGTDAQGIVTRLGYACSGIVYAALAFESARMALGGAIGGSSNGAADWTATLMEQPFGRYLVGIAGMILLGTGLYQFHRAWSDGFMEMLMTQQMSVREVSWSKRLGRCGFAARGVVYLIIGGFLIGAAVKIDPQNAVGMGEALTYLAQQPYGPWILGVVAIGLAAYGLFSAGVLARFRRVSL